MRAYCLASNGMVSWESHERVQDKAELSSETELEAFMKIAIVGSRDYPTRSEVEAFVYVLPQDTEIVSGGARGVDTWAQLAAVKRGLKVTIFKAAWHIHGKGAGFWRNHDIVAYADKIVAFWDGESRGTAHTIQLAKDASKPVDIHVCNKVIHV